METWCVWVHRRSPLLSLYLLEKPIEWKLTSPDSTVDDFGTCLYLLEKPIEWKLA